MYFDYIEVEGAVRTAADEAADLPTAFALGENYPNPFNPATVIPYALPQASHVRLEVFDLTGRRVATLVDGPRPAGTFTARFEARDLASGLYLYRLQAGTHVQTRRMVLIK